MSAYFWQPSPWLHRCVFLLVLLAVFALLNSTVAQPYKVILLIIYALYAVLTWWRLLCVKQARYGYGLRYKAKTWQLWTSETGWQSIKLSAQTVVLPWLLVIYYRRPHQRFAGALVVPWHVLDAESHRKLRVQLRFLA